MATHGEKPRPPVGRTSGRLRGESHGRRHDGSFMCSTASRSRSATRLRAEPPRNARPSTSEVLVETASVEPAPPDNLTPPRAREEWESGVEGRISGWTMPNVTLAAKLAGVAQTHAYWARDHDGEFHSAWDDALEQSCDALEVFAYRMSTTGLEITETRRTIERELGPDGRLVVTRERSTWRSRRAWSRRRCDVPAPRTPTREVRAAPAAGRSRNSSCARRAAGVSQATRPEAGA